MDFPAKLVIEINDESEFDLLGRLFKGNTTLTDDELSTLVTIKEKIEFHLVDESLSSRVLINNTEICKGTLQDMQARFHTECEMHVKSSVVLQSWINGEWKQKGARILQNMTN